MYCNIQLLQLISANVIGTSLPANLSFNVSEYQGNIEQTDTNIKDDPRVYYIIGISIMILLIVAVIAMSYFVYTGYKTQFSLSKLGGHLNTTCLKVKTMILIV